MTRRFAIGPESAIELSAGFLWALIVFVATMVSGGTIWCTTIYFKIEALESGNASKTEQISSIEDKLQDVEVNVTKILYILDPPTSRAILIGALKNQTPSNP